MKMKAARELTGGVAHDLNNLLGIIIGNLDMLLQRAEADSKRSELVQETINSALRGTELVQRLLAFSRNQLPAATVMNEQQPLRRSLSRLDKDLSCETD